MEEWLRHLSLDSSDVNYRPNADRLSKCKKMIDDWRTKVLLDKKIDKIYCTPKTWEVLLSFVIGIEIDSKSVSFFYDGLDLVFVLVRNQNMCFKNKLLDIGKQRSFFWYKNVDFKKSRVFFGVILNTCTVLDIMVLNIVMKITTYSFKKKTKRLFIKTHR